VNSGHTDTIFYYDHDDWLGTERARTDLTGTVCEQIASLPFGDNQTITSTCGDLSPLHFTGKERDGESGLDNFEARYYGSSLGRFMTPDWAARPTAVPYAVFGDPQSLNLYGYGEPSLARLAAAYAFGIARNHPFVDGNKRVAFAVMDVFLRINGYRLTTDSTSIHAFMMELFELHRFDMEHLVPWLQGIVDSQT